MTTLEMARRLLEPELMDPDLAALLSMCAAVESQDAAQRAEALLVLYRARHIVGDEAGARDCALHALALALAHELPAMTLEAGRALFRLYAGAVMFGPLMPGLEEAYAARTGVKPGDGALAPVDPPGTLAGPIYP